MLRLRDVASFVRSKNAGPFWITVDIFFDDPALFRLTRDSFQEAPNTLAEALETDPGMIKLFNLDDLAIIKVSYPRKVAQGHRFERDMHAGQQYVRLLDIDVEQSVR